MQMFEDFLATIPKNRYDMVNYLDLPDDITVSPYIWTETEPLLPRRDSVLSTLRCNSILSECTDDLCTVCTDSSMPLSRAMTDSDIDYELYRRYKNRRFSDTWYEMKYALDAFPLGYLSSLRSYYDLSYYPVETSYQRIRRYNDELRLKMQKFLDEECLVYAPDDPGLIALEDALLGVDIAAIDSELDRARHTYSCGCVVTRL